jgi:CBS domain containing-hemolysin-like protein
MPISDFNEKLNLNITQEGFDTIGGYVFDLFGKIPEKGETIKDGHVQFTIKDINGTIIDRITVTMTKQK